MNRPLPLLAQQYSLTDADRAQIEGTPGTQACYDPRTRTLHWWLDEEGRWIAQPVENPPIWRQRHLARSTWYRRTSPTTLARRVKAVRREVQKVMDHVLQVHTALLKECDKLLADLGEASDWEQYLRERERRQAEEERAWEERVEAVRRRLEEMMNGNLMSHENGET